MKETVKLGPTIRSPSPTAVLNKRPFAGPIFVALKVGATGLALVLVARLVDPYALMERFRNSDPLLLVLTLGLSIAQIPLVGLRWRLIVRAMSNEQAAVPSPAMFQQITWIAQFFGQVLPFVAGDGVRVVLLRGTGTSLIVAFKSTLLDRAIAALALLVIALPAVMSSDVLASAGGSMPVILFIAAGLVSTIVMLAAVGLIHRMACRWRVLVTLAETMQDFRDILLSWNYAPRLVALCVTIHGISTIVFWLLARGQNLPLELIDAMAVVPVILLIAMIPIAVAGWGLREAFVVALLGAAGISPDAALFLSLMFGTMLLLASLPGVAILLLFTRATGPRSTNRTEPPDFA